jgi:hypothetical protein
LPPHAQDFLGLYVIRGYGSVLLPTTPGRYVRIVRTFAPASSSLLQAALSWLTGSMPEFYDARFAAALQRSWSPPPCPACPLQATGYHASPLEAQWAARAREYAAPASGGFCGVIEAEHAVWQQWLDEISAQRSPEIGGVRGVPAWEKCARGRIVV